MRYFFSGSREKDWGMSHLARSSRTGYDKGRTTTTRHDHLKKMQGISHQRRREYLFHSQWHTMKNGQGIQLCIVPLIYNCLS
ncbi:hypothetical protein D9M71_788690 [compost metagenome]